MKKYSVVFMPDAQTIESVKQMKTDLADQIGWFHSKNALAHFTIFEFLADDATEAVFCAQLERIASEIKSFKVICNTFDSFENGAFYIKPNEEAVNQMSLLMKQVLQESNRIKKSITNTTPHLSIARKLTPEKLAIAKKLFTQIHLGFEVAHITLRKFDETLKQFTIYKEFPLLGKPAETQGNLF